MDNIETIVGDIRRTAKADLRTSYEIGFRLLNTLMIDNHWARVEDVLRRLCADHEDWRVATGCLRLCAPQREHIRNWNDLLANLRGRLAGEDEDPDYILRGLENACLSG